MTQLDPNPHSPYANATPDVRHIFANPIFFPAPNPGGLALTACEGMAVVPTDLVQTEPNAELPDGLCPDCVTVMQGGNPPKRTSSECGECGSATWHGVLCALCRQEKHEAWWPTRESEEQRRVEPIALPAHWDCAHGVSDDEPFCAEGEDHVCPTIRVHPDDAEAFAALVAEARHGRQVEVEPEAIHAHFGLTYANYLVLNRTLLQSMPDLWQTQFVALLDQLHEAFAHVPQAEGYKVEAATEHEVCDLDDEQLAQLGITEDRYRGETPPEGLDAEGLAEWEEAHESPDGPVYSRDGEEVDGGELVMLPAVDPVPHYNRGRTYIAPAVAVLGGKQ